MANIWDDEKVSDYDLIEEDAKNAEELAEQYAATPVISEASEEVLEEIAEESAFSLNTNEANVVFNARLRLEQAKLYEMLINHNLFEGVDASPEAIANVQNELKFYIVKRLEILLGIREPTIRQQPAAVAEPSLNDVEVDFLKQLAYKGTLGASATGRAARAEEQIKPLSTAAPSQKLKSLSPVKRSAPRIKAEPAKQVVVQQQPQKQVKAAPAQAQKKQPVRQSAKSSVKLRESGNGRELSEKEAEMIALEDLKNMPSKPFKDMNAKEKAERIRQVNEKHKRPAPTKGVAPMPSSNELEMKYLNQQTNRSYSKNQSDQFNSILANALAVQKNRGEQDE